MIYVFSLISVEPSQTWSSLSNNDPVSSKHKVDLLSALGLFHNISVFHGGVVLKPGPHSASPSALFLEGSLERDVHVHSRDLWNLAKQSNDLPNTYKQSMLSRSQMGQLLLKLLDGHHLSREISVMASIKQWKGNTGSLMALVHNQPNGKRQSLLELQSSGRQNTLRIIYRANVLQHLTSSSPPSSSIYESVTVVETLPLVLADESWHKLTVTITGDLLHVYLDCK